MCEVRTCLWAHGRRVHRGPTKTRMHRGLTRTGAQGTDYSGAQVPVGARGTGACASGEEQARPKMSEFEANLQAKLLRQSHSAAGPSPQLARAQGLGLSFILGAIRSHTAYSVRKRKGDLTRGEGEPA